MRETQGNRKDDEPATGSTSGGKPAPRWFNRIPSRIWFPAGFVGFLFIIGGWNQLYSTWAGLSGRPSAGSSLPLGFLVALGVLLACTLFGLQALIRERRGRSRESKHGRDWKNELHGKNDDIRFP